MIIGASITYMLSFESGTLAKKIVISSLSHRPVSLSKSYLFSTAFIKCWKSRN